MITAQLHIASARLLLAELPSYASTGMPMTVKFNDEGLNRPGVSQTSGSGFIRT